MAEPKGFLQRLKKKLKLYASVNWRKTLYFNYKKFPNSVARKLPVVFYGRVKLRDISGEVILKGPIRMGMIGFGQKFEKMTRSRGIAEINLSGRLIFHGSAIIGNDYCLFVARDAHCEIGDLVAIGSMVKIICMHNIVLGTCARIGFESQLIDTRVHPMKNTETGEEYEILGPIVIGNYNSVSNRVSFMPDTYTPDYCVVASNSVCNKDYRELGNNILIGGIPAKLLKINFSRDWEKEKELIKHQNVVKF